MSTKEEGVSFSPREMQVLALAWQCFDTDPKINYKKLACLAGYKEGSASVIFNKIKRKLKQASTDAPDGSSTTPASTPRKPATPKTPKSGKRSAPAVAADDESPIKKKRKTTLKKPMQQDTNDDEEFSDIRVKSEEVAGVLQGAEEYFGNCGYGHTGNATYEDDGYGI